ncbi:RNA-directed DNA polymerase, eukaryota, reverse transcriptase zinc-binding domain protein [Tanacetum coccineum]
MRMREWVFGKITKPASKLLVNPFVKDVEKITMLFFVTNFPESLDANNIEGCFTRFGRIVDAFIANKRSKTGKRFSFVRFLGVRNGEDFAKTMSNIWIGSYHLFVMEVVFKGRTEALYVLYSYVWWLMVWIQFKNSKSAKLQGRNESSSLFGLSSVNFMVRVLMFMFTKLALVVAEKGKSHLQMRAHVETAVICGNSSSHEQSALFGSQNSRWSFYAKEVLDCIRKQKDVTFKVDFEMFDLRKLAFPDHVMERLVLVSTWGVMDYGWFNVFKASSRHGIVLHGVSLKRGLRQGDMVFFYYHSYGGFTASLKDGLLTTIFSKFVRAGSRNWFICREKKSKIALLDDRIVNGLWGGIGVAYCPHRLNLHPVCASQYLEALAVVGFVSLKDPTLYSVDEWDIGKPRAKA